VELSVWGLSASHKKSWEALIHGDTIFLYATVPVKGVIGYGTVIGKKIQERPIWEEEREIDSALWPLHIYFEIRACLPPDNWETNSIRVPKNIPLRRAIQRLKDEIAEELVVTFKKLGDIEGKG